jgi:hypothetical protein
MPIEIAAFGSEQADPQLVPSSIYTITPAAAAHAASKVYANNCVQFMQHSQD